MSNKILLVEDEKNIVLGVTICLRSEGLEVEVAEDGADALRKIEAEKPALVLLDLVMPKLNGLDALQIMKEKEEMKDIPVIVLSARAQEEDIQRAMDLGANDYMAKPFRPDELLAVIDRVLGR
ncbi:response regulator transcription factor [Dethiobacter alkaliphilus]|uniref:Response regulator receiver protein n=1 Tax=Dethiobacter alkaliphilus AHT 1 TaxID=555088 RepID=C0GJP3_DETAL|nr:response regulator [Dethiobacter alkaliphilus]EEG76465.1 response regulator receiver protein [Dethiobacter alkaliphilus AHT 1]